MTTTCLSQKDVEAELCAENLKPGTHEYLIAFADRFVPVDPTESRPGYKLYQRRTSPPQLD